ncbi:MAG: hypothetical protein H6581_06035 [Bacteroidia bacterium]|nr:hypothetical protein [Bacteroidia bacterium]
MKYIEYIYLAAAVVLVVILATGFANFKDVQIIMILVSVVVTSFMFSFRRRQRKAMEKREAAELRKMEEDAAD